MSNNRQRLRIRFHKEGDLRWLSHRDLARAFERLFRRIELPLAMSEGFHPHPRISFPSALAVGIAGQDEVVEVVLSEHVDVEATQQCLTKQVPEGITIVDVRALESSDPKAKIEQAVYTIHIPASRVDATQTAISHFLDHREWKVERKIARKKPKTLDIRPMVESIELQSERLCMRLYHSQELNVKPREVLAALNLEDLEDEGSWLTRTEVKLTT